MEKLEYRGYDSAGIALCGTSRFEVLKKKGRLSVLKEALAATPLEGTTGIGHTRWATHGEPIDVNSHPHVGNKGKIAIVHNGIIENYTELKAWLEEQGICFQSQTDSEVIAQLAEHYYDGNLLSTITKVSSVLKGSYALGALCLDDPHTIVALRKDNPLIIGTTPQGSFLASDVTAILSYTREVYYLADNQIAVLAPHDVHFYNTNQESITLVRETIQWSAKSAEKGGYPHFMLKEIMEQPQVMEETIKSATKGENKKIIETLTNKRFKKISITACGSAYNAGVVAQYGIEKLCRIPVEVEFASEFRYKDPLIDEETLVILISQSGETADTLAALRHARSKKATILSIVNVVGSTIAKESDYCLFTAAGPEISVATTKAFSTQLILLYMVALSFAQSLGVLSDERANQLLEEIKLLPEKARAILSSANDIQRYAATCMGCKSIFFIGRNIDYAIALEGSLKLKEISYIHSEAYAGGELKHGTISLIEDNTLVVALLNSKELACKTISNVEQVMSRGAKVLLIGSEGGSMDADKLTAITIPSTEDIFSPSLSAIALQLFSYFVAANKGLNIDKPRNLAKSVTVE